MTHSCLPLTVLPICALSLFSLFSFPGLFLLSPHHCLVSPCVVISEAIMIVTFPYGSAGMSTSRWSSCLLLRLPPISSVQLWKCTWTERILHSSDLDTMTRLVWLLCFLSTHTFCRSVVVLCLPVGRRLFCCCQLWRFGDFDKRQIKSRADSVDGSDVAGLGSGGWQLSLVLRTVLLGSEPGNETVCTRPSLVA